MSYHNYLDGMIGSYDDEYVCHHTELEEKNLKWQRGYEVFVCLFLFYFK